MLQVRRTSNGLARHIYVLMISLELNTYTDVELDA